MIGYLNKPEATAETLDADGFLHTGDIATVTEDGVFSIVDRVKELIKYKGYQMAPAELEALLLTHEAIADAAVIGVLDDDGRRSRRRSSCGRRRAPVSPTTTSWRSSPSGSPRTRRCGVVEFIDEIPKSTSGKILRKDLRAREPQAT